MNPTLNVHECYRILEVDPGAPLEEVKRSYRTLMKVWHPDRFQHDNSMLARVQEKTKSLNLAYDTLCKRSEIQTPPSCHTPKPPARSGTEPRQPTGVHADSSAAGLSWRLPSDPSAATLDREALRREAIHASFARGAGIRKATVYVGGAHGGMSFEPRGGDTARHGWVLLSTNGRPMDLLPEEGAATAEEAKVHFYAKWKNYLFTHGL